MWLLKDSKGKIKYLKPGKKVTVGRKQADVILENDSSISRAHAEITVALKEQMKTSEVSSVCTIIDVNSKYGTLITRKNAQIRVSQDGMDLEPQDTIKFGLQQHVFSLEHIPFITVISRLSFEHKNKLKDIMDCIGGIVIDCYDVNCTHLTATTATSTDKIISAVIAGIPIVNIEYWMAVVRAIDTNSNLPNPDEFTLPLQDEGVNNKRVSLKPNSNRKTLFQGKTFIFFCDKIFKDYKKMIKDAGGKAELHSSNVEHISENLLADNNIIVQTPDTSMTNKLSTFNSMLYDKMLEKKIRMIAETEIPLAILYVTLNQYCNPKYHFKELMKRKSLKEDKSEVLALDTQDVLPEAHDYNVKNQPSTSTQAYVPETDDICSLDVPSCVSDTKFNSATKTRGLKNASVELQNNSSDMNSLRPDIESQISKIVEKDVNINKFSKRFDLKNKSSYSEQSREKKKNDEDDGEFEGEGNEKHSDILPVKSTHVLHDNEKTKNRKRQSEVVSCNENDWKSTKDDTVEIRKKRRISLKTDRNDDFMELERQKIKTKDNQDKLSKWGFKKSEKKVIDFDLDDVEAEEPKDQSIKNVPYYKKKEDVKLSDVSKNNQGNVNFKMTSNSNLGFKENIKNWTNADKAEGSASSLVVKREISKPILTRSKVKSEANSDSSMNYKTFKKVSNPVPLKRIALSNMTIWKS